MAGYEYQLKAARDAAVTKPISSARRCSPLKDWLALVGGRLSIELPTLLGRILMMKDVRHSGSAPDGQVLFLADLTKM